MKFDWDKNFLLDILFKPYFVNTYPDSMVRGANMGPIWSRQDPGGPHVGPMNFAIWVGISLNNWVGLGHMVP